MKKQFTLLLVLLISAFSVNAQIYVNAAATGNNDGTTWTDAYTDLQDALADANVATEEIWVVAGTYKPTTLSDRSIYFEIPNGAQVYGGFDGTETLLQERNYEFNITILSGDIPGSNSYHVVSLVDVDNTTLVDGFTITAGNANGPGFQVDEDYGGGIFISADAADCAPQIFNCLVTGNHADYQGGGIYVQSTGVFLCAPHIYNCRISSNTCTNYGGGIFVFGDNGEASPVVENCIISGNSSVIEGGGIATEGFETNGLCGASFISCVISGNSSNAGGGMFAWGVEGGFNNSTFLNCTFAGNDAGSEGGSFSHWSEQLNNLDIVLLNCLVWGNSSLMYNLDAIDPQFTYYYCDIEGTTPWDNAIGTDGGNNIDTNPYFNAPILPSLTTAGDFRNHYASEAIGAGNPAEYPADDLDGNPFNNPPSIGAYEYSPLPGDWNGSSDSDWGTADNWETGVVATAGDDVYISSKATNYPVINEAGATPAECNHLELLASTSLSIEPLAGLTVHGNLVIDPTANYSINGDVKDIGSLITLGTVSGKIEAERYIGEDEWHLVSTPVIDETANIFYGNYLQTYDESTQTWTEIEDETTLLNPMTGYAMWGTTGPDTYYPFAGEPSTGFQSQNFSADNTYGWNLFGNPYPSSIDWESLTIPPDMNEAVYYLEASSGNYLSYVPGAGGSGSQYVPPMQGFWISATDAGTLAFGNSDRTHLGTDEYYKSEKEISNYIALQVQSGDMLDKTYIRLNDQATPAFDGKYDAYKLMAPNKIYPQIYTIAGEDNLSISQLPATDVIPLGFYVKNSGDYTISLEKMTDIQSCQIEDLKTGIVQDLEKGTYTFSYTEGENDERFRLHLSAASVDFSGAEDNIKMYAAGQEVFIKSMNPIEKGTVRITDLAGRTLIEESVSNENFVRLSTNLNTGVYIVSISESNGVRTQKIIIN